MRLSEFKNKTVACWGYGMEIKSFIKKMKYYCPKKIIVIDKDKIDFQDYISEKNILNHIDEIDIIVKSSGVSIYSELFEKVTKQIPYTTIPNIFLSEIKEHRKTHTAPITIGITGTKGKSTVSSLLNHILNYLGFVSVIAGNIGVSLLDILDGLKRDFIVAELSSHQVASLNKSPDISVLINLFPEHIHWHKSHENYFKDKLRLLEIEKNDKIKIDTRKINFEKLSFELKNTSLLGDHNTKNIISVIEILKKLNIQFNQKTIEAIQNYKGLPHRLEIIKTGKITYIDDSISTIPESTIEAIKTFQCKEINLILGGKNREQNYDKLSNFLKTTQAVKRIFIIGETAEIIYTSLLRSGFPIKSIYKKQTLQKAMEQINKIVTTGVVLLSPAAPSYDQFKNFIDRGNKFRLLVKK